MILTDYRRPMDLIRFKRDSGNKTYLIFGGTSAWPDDEHPPEIPAGTKTIPDAFCACKAEIKWVKEDVAGIYSAKIPDDNGVVQIVKFSEMLTESAVLAHTGNIYCLMMASLSDSNIPLISNWRKLGFSVDLVPTAGHESDTFLLAANVSNWGVLETLEYRKPFPVSSGVDHQFVEVVQY